MRDIFIIQNSKRKNETADIKCMLESGNYVAQSDGTVHLFCTACNVQRITYWNTYGSNIQPHSHIWPDGPGMGQGH